MTIKEVPLKEIIQTRYLFNQNRIEEYLEEIDNERKIKRLRARKEGGKYFLLDGCHAYEALIKRDRKSHICEIIEEEMFQVNLN